MMIPGTWYVKTRGVTGFVGPGKTSASYGKGNGKPWCNKGIRTCHRFSVGDTVTVISGPWEGHSGMIREINMENRQFRSILMCLDVIPG